MDISDADATENSHPKLTHLIYYKNKIRNDVNDGQEFPNCTLGGRTPELFYHYQIV